MRNFQLPIFYYEKNYKKNDFSKNLRKLCLKKDNKKIFYNFCREEISLLLPKAFLRNFDEIKKAIKISYFPKKTKKNFYKFKL